VCKGEKGKAHPEQSVSSGPPPLPRTTISNTGSTVSRLWLTDIRSPCRVSVPLALAVELEPAPTPLLALLPDRSSAITPLFALPLNLSFAPDGRGVREPDLPPLLRVIISSCTCSALPSNERFDEITETGTMRSTTIVLQLGCYRRARAARAEASWSLRYCLVWGVCWMSRESKGLPVDLGYPCCRRHRRAQRSYQTRPR
jgi:hypothetical protein